MNAAGRFEPQEAPGELRCQDVSAETQPPLAIHT